jgi:hypothetical protein
MPKKLEVQYSKTTTLKLELVGMTKSDDKWYADVECSLLVDGIVIAQSRRTLGVGDKIDFAYDQAVISFLSFAGLDPMIENLKIVERKLLPRGEGDDS